MPRMYRARFLLAKTILMLQGVFAMEQAAAESSKLIRKEALASETLSQTVHAPRKRPPIELMPGGRVVHRFEIILEDELEKAEKLGLADRPQHLPSTLHRVQAHAPLPPMRHALAHEEEDNDQHEISEDDDEEDRKRFGLSGPPGRRLTTTGAPMKA